MKHFLLLLLTTFSFTISAQDTLVVEFVDTPPQLRTEDFPQASKSPGISDLFLYSVYRSVRYPAYAREYGVPTIVRVNYLVDTNGKTSIEHTASYTFEEATQLDFPEDEFITFTSSTTCILRPFGSTDVPLVPPTPTINEEQLAKANKLLEEVVETSILKVPAYTPGSHQGEPVAVRYTRFFSFQKEEAR